MTGRLAMIMLITVLSKTLFGQAGSLTDGENVARRIVGAGYENVRIARSGDTLYASLENRVWRYEARGAAEALKLLMPMTDSAGVVSLTLLRMGIPATTLVVPRKQFEQLKAGIVTKTGFADSIAVLISDQSYKRRLAGVRRINPSFNRFDVVVFPQLKFQFGNFVHPLELQFNIAPAVKITFFKGLSFTGQVIFPVYNNLIGDPEGNTIRPGLIVVSQVFRLPHNFFTTVSAGYFTRDRYGINGEVRKLFLNGRLGVNLSMGYTGQMQLLEGKFTYWPMDAFTWFGDLSWRFARYDLTLRGGYGRFIDGDKGWRFDVRRQFGEVSIGLFAMQTGGITNGGFNFVVPLPPRKLGTKNRIRLRPAPYVPWEYRAKGLPAYGRTFNTGSGTEEFLFDLNPDQIRTQLGKQLLFE